jgi:hypothetical protein
MAMSVPPTMHRFNEIDYFYAGTRTEGEVFGTALTSIAPSIRTAPARIEKDRSILPLLL